MMIQHGRLQLRPPPRHHRFKTSKRQNSLLTLILVHQIILGQSHVFQPRYFSNVPQFGVFLFISIPRDEDRAGDHGTGLSPGGVVRPPSLRLMSFKNQSMLHSQLPV